MKIYLNHLLHMCTLTMCHSILYVHRTNFPQHNSHRFLQMVFGISIHHIETKLINADAQKSTIKETEHLEIITESKAFFRPQDHLEESELMKIQ